MRTPGAGLRCPAPRPGTQAQCTPCTWIGTPTGRPGRDRPGRWQSRALADVAAAPRASTPATAAMTLLIFPPVLFATQKNGGCRSVPSAEKTDSGERRARRGAARQGAWRERRRGTVRPVIAQASWGGLGLRLNRFSRMARPAGFFLRAADRGGTFAGLQRYCRRAWGSANQGEAAVPASGSATQVAHTQEGSGGGDIRAHALR